MLLAVIRPYFDYVTGFLTAFDGRANPLDAELVYLIRIVLYWFTVV
jgi:hypothetical protein